MVLVGYVEFLGNAILVYGVLLFVPFFFAGKLFAEFLLSKEGIDIMVEREVSIISYRKGYVPPESVKKYALDLSKIKVIGIRDELETNKQFKGMREEWGKVFQ